MTFTPSEDGTYHVEAGGYRGSGFYTLSVADVTPRPEPTPNPVDDYPGHSGSTATVAVGGSVTGEVGTINYRDWFAVNLEEGKFYQFDLEGVPTGRGTLENPYLNGIYLAQSSQVIGWVTARDDNLSLIHI